MAKPGIHETASCRRWPGTRRPPGSFSALFRREPACGKAGPGCPRPASSCRWLLVAGLAAAPLHSGSGRWGIPAPRALSPLVLVPLLAALAPLLLAATAAPGAGRGLTDMGGRSVRLPAEIRRVVTVSDGLIEGVMTCFGVQDRIVGLGSRALQKSWSYSFQGEGGERFVYRGGMNPVRFLNPRFAELPLVCDGPAVNMERLAGLAPDLVILRLGSCNLPGREDGVKMTIRAIESLGIPLVVLEGPNAAGRPAVSSISGEIRLLGEVFERQREADRLVSALEGRVNLTRERTQGIPEAARPRVLLFGPSRGARDQGVAGQAFGLDTLESVFIEEWVNARNAFRERGSFRLVSAEQLLALDPDVIVLCTAAGYHPPRELYEAPYCRHLREMRAVRGRRVSALPWTPWNCEKRLEYPIDVMVIARAAYPERFADIDLAAWVLDFYVSVYGVDRSTAERLRSCQWLDWTLEGGGAGPRLSGDR